MAEKSIEGQLRENVARLRNIEMNIGFATEQLQNLERITLELAATKKALTEMQNIKKDTASILPLGSGFFASGVLQRQDKIFAEVGAGVILEKTIEDALKIIAERETNVKNNVTAFQQQLGGLEKEYGELSVETEKLAKK